LFDLLADAWTQLRADSEGGENAGLLDRLIGELRGTADDPPRKIEGVSEAFLEGLERVPKGKLKGGKCPICGEGFLSGEFSFVCGFSDGGCAVERCCGLIWLRRGLDPYPLVVALPCHPDHTFDYECIRPWLKLNPTCPLDRKNLVEKKKPPPPPEDEEEEDYDDYYA
jgi:RING finger family protein